MKKFYVSILSLTALLALTGCGEKVSYKEIVVEPQVSISSLFVSEPGFVMFKGETQQIHVNVRPLDAPSSSVGYKSSNKKVATVDENGLITAVGGGSAYIRAYSKEDPSIYEDVAVGVETNLITATDTKTRREQRKDVNKKLGNQQDIQEEKYMSGGSNSLDKVQVNNCYYISRTCDGEHYYSEVVRQDFTACKSLGFFHFAINDVETRSPEGKPSFDRFGYYMFCNENYDAHAYKYSDSSAKRAYISAEDFIGQVDRIEVVMMMLDNIFTSQRKILTNQFDNALENSSFSASAADLGGYTADGKKSGGYRKNPKGQSYTIQNEDEDDLDIPAGTETTLSQGSAFHWTNGRIDASESIMTIEYELDGHQYVYTQQAFTNVYIEDEVDIVYPNKDDYQEVGSFIELFM